MRMPKATKKMTPSPPSNVAAVVQANEDERWVSSVAISYVLDDERRERRIAVRAARREGIEQGIEQGEDRFGALAAALVADGRAEDVVLAAQDRSSRTELFEEYGL